MSATQIHPALSENSQSVDGSLTPVLHEVIEVRRETDDVTTIAVEPVSGARMSFRAGQFNMLTAFGVGEVAISLSGAPRELGPLRHTIRDVGVVSHALARSVVGDVIGVRGPFGTDWRVPIDHRTDPTGDADVLVVAGGIGLAPLRGAVNELVAHSREGGGRLFVFAGAREPSQIVFQEDLDAWARSGASVEVTVDRASPLWRGHVGQVTSLLRANLFDASNARALICGPEIMMRFTARALVDLGVSEQRILVSLERNMQCGLGWCGHCQLGPLMLCRDGPIVEYGSVVNRLLNERER